MSNPPLREGLEASGNKPLRFGLHGQQLIPNDFHVTEVKRVTVEALDCGGGRGQWQELVIQCWSPRSDDTAQPMTAKKFLDILATADALELLGSVPMRVEYGAANQPAIQYTVEGLAEREEMLEIDLRAPYVGCKPRERETALQELNVVQTCCAPDNVDSCCA